MDFNPKTNPNAKVFLKGLCDFKNSLVERNTAFTQQEFLSGLKEIGLLSNSHFWRTVLNTELPILKCKLLTRVRRDGFVFTKPKDPIHHSDLQFLYSVYSKTIKKYQQAHKEKKNGQKPEKVQVSDEVRKAIELLKSNGFEVLAPVAMLYAKM